MSNKPLKLTRDETLALVCALIITVILSAYSLYLKQQETAEIIIVSLAEYAEPFHVPRNHSDFVPRESGRTKPGSSSTTSDSALRAAKDSTDTVHLAESRLSLAPDSLAEVERTARDSTSTEWSVVFGPYNRSWELDSIMTMPGEPGIALLRQHVIHESRAYDTAVANHLIRSAKALTQVDVSQTLETQMKFNVGRYGLPYNPLRPQPPSAQVPVKGIVVWVLGFLYAQAKEVPAAVSRMIKPSDKKASK